jgi:hypothetical protein
MTALTRPSETQEGSMAESINASWRFIADPDWRIRKSRVPAAAWGTNIVVSIASNDVDINGCASDFLEEGVHLI